MKRFLFLFVAFCFLFSIPNAFAQGWDSGYGSTPDPTVTPTQEPTLNPTPEPTVQPTQEPTQEPTVAPTFSCSSADSDGDGVNDCDDDCDTPAISSVGLTVGEDGCHTCADDYEEQSDGTCLLKPKPTKCEDLKPKQISPKCACTDDPKFGGVDNPDSDKDCDTGKSCKVNKSSGGWKISCV